MAKALSAFVLLGVALGALASQSKSAPLAEPAAANFVNATLGGVAYTNKGMVGFGLMPSNFTDSTGDTFGGVGSAIALKRGTWKQLSNGSFTGTLFVQPDRGYNVITTVDYRARHHEINFVLSPYYNTTNLTFAAAQSTLAVHYAKTILHYDRWNGNTSGLDALGVRPAVLGFPNKYLPLSDPPLPIANATYTHLTIDAEGLVEMPDGTLWVSDEYGPYIYRFTANGRLIQTIQPPAAILPLNVTGGLNFTSVPNPTTGRAPNQGFEGLAYDQTRSRLYALLQSATIQDGGAVDTTQQWTRLLAWDVSNPLERPPLVGEWVVELPLTKKGKTNAASELHFVSENVFLALSRDGKGRGDDGSTTSAYKQVDLFSIANATNIANTAFDSPSTPIAVNGVLNSTITPATYVSFLSLIDGVQLGRFGLHNGDPDDATLIDGKFESLALAPCRDPAFKDDYFLFTVADNDFQTTQGVSVGVPYNMGVDEDTQFLVFRVTLPGLESIGI
ncbi:hypothetical protein FIBSPDRAFT_789968 [Athelia psychrophila]|uniref:Phytase-like domain-containing protein n=1 Tax=Athelia psychrophila TaxID=1759441 RepID=A0A166IMX3_9AGAM|nr:hypothetical protein FIBSPDRAFT_789968 [Fibularhizoctonia sp. CBS 109695]